MSETLNPVTTRPMDLKPDDRLGYKVIAVIRYDNSWTAYIGLTDWSDDRVASEGDALNQKAAEAMFYAPVAAGLRYSI